MFYAVFEKFHQLRMIKDLIQFDFPTLSNAFMCFCNNNNNNKNPGFLQNYLNNGVILPESKIYSGEYL
jgi:hypothetical protein